MSQKYLHLTKTVSMLLRTKPYHVTRFKVSGLNCFLTLKNQRNTLSFQDTCKEFIDIDFVKEKKNDCLQRPEPFFFNLVEIESILNNY